MNSNIKRRLERLEAASKQDVERCAPARRPRNSNREIMRRAVAALERAVTLLTEIQREQDRPPTELPRIG